MTTEPTQTDAGSEETAPAGPNDSGLTTEAMHASMPLTASLGVELVSAAPDEVVLRLPWAAGLTTVGEQLHGGALMSLADSAAAICAFLNLPDGAVGTTTVEASTKMLRGVRPGDVVEARSTPMHLGSSVAVIDTRLTVGDRLVATTAQTQLVLRPR